MNQSNVSIYHDTRRETKKKKYPVKIRVYYDGETRFYRTGIYLTKQEYEQSYLTLKPTVQASKELKIKIQSIEAKANSVINDLKNFTFDIFERKFIRPTGAGTNVFYFYERRQAELKRDDRIKSASICDLSAKSLKHYLKENGRKSETLSFNSVNEAFLNDYEKWMIRENKSRTTVGIYLRELRSVFNTAISEGEIGRELYPFGKRRYQIPAGMNIKKSLTKDELRALFELPITNYYAQKARDFWFFSYVCNGINMRDIAGLQFKNIRKDSLSFIRTKTRNTTRSNHKPIIIPLTDFTKSVINKYGNKESKPEDYVFPIFTNSMTEFQKVKAVHQFTRFVNEHIKKLGKAAGITDDITTYWARHSFTTVAVQNGASLEFIMNSLGHTTMATTMKYFGGFDESVKKSITEKLMEF